MCAHLCNSRAGEETALHVIMSLNEVALSLCIASVSEYCTGDGGL
jgi:hypothetical protein